jgi:hypothetical protein
MDKGAEVGARGGGQREKGMFSQFKIISCADNLISYEI